MTTKHTPGHWFVGETHKDDEGYAEIAVMASVDGKAVAPAVVVLQFPNVPGMQEANARLIAAAPELLKALEDLLAYHTQPTGFDTAVFMDDQQFGEFLKGISTNGDELANKASAAIAKAKGEQQRHNAGQPRAASWPMSPAEYLAQRLREDDEDLQDLMDRDMGG